MSNVDRILGEAWDGLKDNRRLVLWMGLAVAAFWLLQRAIRGGIQAFWTLFGLGMAFYFSGASGVLKALF
ncbi:MAG: hypothetical protein LW860_18000 [Xanthomonadaceae bacterium]|jgi:hypothetical protein|nr:hypothetical protein [Xanthomonadaceae bacterium]